MAKDQGTAKNARGKKTTAGAGGRKSGARKAAARKTGARKTAAARKGGARKAGAGTGGARKTAGRKSVARKTGTRKAAARKTSTRRPSARTGGARKTVARKTAGARKTTARKTGGRGGAAKTGGRSVLWIESPDQHAARPGQTLATRNHDVIRQWAEERGASPATVGGTEHADRLGVLRFDFPYGGKSEGLQQVEWDEWFGTFDDRNLVFLFQEQLRSGRQSNFFKLDNPDREDG